MHKFDKNPCMDFKGELCSERNATLIKASQRNATQRKFYHCISKRKSFSESPV